MPLHILQVFAVLYTLIQPQAHSDALLTRNITVSQAGSEYRVKILARAAGTSWEIEGHECAMLKIAIDGRYDQHLFLVRGSQEAEYEFLVGPLDAGDHSLQFFWDRSWTPDLTGPPEMRVADVVPIGHSDPAQEPLLRAPIIHIRKDTVGRFSDLPLVVYWETEKAGSQSKVIYSVILSNEDGGTNTERLMARWGRTTDIEWFYEYSKNGELTEETYQAPKHKTLHFQGKHEGKHPVLYDATVNNNFLDTLEDYSQVRLRPVPVFEDLSGLTRETVMDRFPWTYSIMAQEMTREIKIEHPADPNTPAISDQRNYAYLEVCAEQRGTELYFELDTRTTARWFRSDHADPKARIERSGCFRTAVELPQGTRPEDLRRLRIQCSPAPPPEGQPPVPSPRADIREVKRLFLLGADYVPGRSILSRQINRSLKPGRSVTIEIPGTGTP